jgi:hypothetical protein
MKGNKENVARSKRRRKRALLMVVVVVTCVVSIRSYFVGNMVGDNKRIRGMRQRAERLGKGKFKSSNPNNLSVLLSQQTNDKHGKAESIDLILSAKVHLTDIRIPRGALSSKHKDNYQKVIGVFCPLNWAAHKKDPSSGTRTLNMRSTMQSLAPG